VAAAGLPAFTLNFNAYSKTCSGTYGGAAVTGSLVSGSAQLEWYDKWSDFPDPTFMGLFPTPSQMTTLLGHGWYQVVFTYKSLVF
jgi:hypothetical protein